MVITGYANMISSLPVSTSAKNIVVLGGRFQQPMGSMFSCVGSQGSPSSCSSCFNPGKFKGKYAALPISDRSSSPSTISFHTFKRNCFGSDSKQSNSLNSTKFKGSTKCKGILRRRLGISLACNNMNMRLLVPIHGKSSKIKCNVGPFSWSQGGLSAGLAFGSFVCYSSSGEAHAEAPQAKEENDSDVSCEERSHGKKLYTDFSVTGIPGDGRCLFRSVAHGACLHSGKPAPNENLQRELADDLRARVADEFIKRRQETEWFIEGDFDTYVSQIRRPHVWGGEPELLMASHVLQMPITVYMYDDGAAGLLAIAEYGQEYGKENPIRVLYHGFGHYDALQIPGRKGGRSRL